MTKKRNKMTFTEGMKAQFSTKSIVLIPIAVGINLIGGTLCSALKLPLFLDMIGTIVIACLSGPWVSALCGLLTNVFFSSGCKSSLSAIFHCQCFMWSYNGVYGEGRTI